MRHRTLACTLLVGGATLSGYAADAPEPAGDLWEVTSQMSMEGMPPGAIPANKVKVCSPTVWTEPPGAADERRKCTNSNFQMDQSGKATWKVTCAGPPAMTGEGELTREGAEAWSGSIKFTASEGIMTIRLGGKRLGGCEPK